MPFEFKGLEIPGLVQIQPRVFKDMRGYFFETFKKSDFVENGIHCDFVQDNYSFSTQNTMRGLHYQLPPAAQGKLVSVLKGRAWDVAVDIRRDSPHYLKWTAVELNEENHIMIYIPPGFAHGFAALSSEVHFFYKCTSQYVQECERGIRWNDPDIGIKWPVANPVISEKDARLPFVHNAEVFAEEVFVY
ncbi:MAG: dTDP-4-dehydrorhamnose 3,5-epimerase [Acidobacteria bacterium]|jgi:dTDP-4-dehydrorhamnose 3,5-epimerase|nr:dTDP-4-dehydrorhamnose 3,5-epimerase [Acidobacteriota bacterium]